MGDMSNRTCRFVRTKSWHVAIDVITEVSLHENFKSLTFIVGQEKVITSPEDQSPFIENFRLFRV